MSLKESNNYYIFSKAKDVGWSLILYHPVLSHAEVWGETNLLTDSS